MSNGISAKAKWNVNQASIDRMMKRYIKSNLGNIENIVDWYAKDAANFIVEKKILRGSATGTTWHRNANLQRGNEYGARFDTGNMASSVGYESFSFNSDNQIGAEFGLPTPAAGGEQYFMNQERGFKIQTKAGEHKVKAMNSATEAHAHMRPRMRRMMLANGFLTGKQDVRGSTVISLMRGVGGKQYSFDAAWAMTGDDRSPAQKAAADAFAKRVNERELRNFIARQNAAANRRVIDSLKLGSGAAFNTYVNYKAQAATRDEAGF